MYTCFCYFQETIASRRKCLCYRTAQQDFSLYSTPRWWSEWEAAFQRLGHHADHDPNAHQWSCL